MNDEAKGEQKPEPPSEGLHPTIGGLIGRAQYMLSSVLDAYAAASEWSEMEKESKRRKRDELESRIVDLTHTKQIRELQLEDLREGQRLRAKEYEEVHQHRLACQEIYRQGFKDIADAIREVGALLKS